LDVGNVLSKSVTVLTANTSYFYRVRAYNTGGTSGNSNTINPTTLPNAPAAPTANAATSITATSFTANWSSSSGATGYRLDVSTSNTFSSFVSGFQDLDVGNVLSKSVTGLSANTTYFYQVRAYNTGGTSGNSNTITVATSAAPPAGTLQFSSGTYTQGESSGTQAITVTRTGGSAGAVSVQLSIAPGSTATGGASCTAGVDYITPSLGTLNWGDGVTTSQIINFTICNDNIFEGDETVNLQLTNATGALLGSPNTAIFTITDDETLQLLLEQSGPAFNQAAALESLLLIRDPFHVQSVEDWWNLGPDRNTRVILLVNNLQLNPGELPSAVQVSLVDANNQTFDVNAEDVRPVSVLGFANVTFRLPNNLAAGVCTVTVKAHSQVSNTGTIRILAP
jgi:Calx-beta domain-containing protein/fibronectin type III domain protein